MVDKKISLFKFYNGQINLYVKNVEVSAQFYSNNFGFKEIFRTPKSGEPDHVELKLDQFILGVASIKSAEEMHGLKVGTDLSKSEIVLWTDDVDAVYKFLLQNNVTGISKPHTFLEVLRSAWIADPDNNFVQIVSKIH